MTVLDGRAESREMPARPAPVTWKLIVAVDAPWTGQMYSTRPGRDRIAFDSVESFCAAMLSLTDWPLQARSDGAGAPHRAPGTRRRTVARRGEQAQTRKFIVAADRPWTGELYRTRPGLGHLHFGTFEQFLRAVMDITGWSLECRGDAVCA